jgi:MYND finger
MHGVPENPAARRAWFSSISERYPGVVRALQAARAEVPPRWSGDDTFFTQLLGFVLHPPYAFARTGDYVFEGTLDTNGDSGMLIVPRSLAPEATGNVVIRCCKAGRLMKRVATQIPSVPDDVPESNSARDAARATVLSWAYRAPATFARRAFERTVFSDMCLNILLPTLRDAQFALFRRRGGLMEITVDRSLLHRLFCGEELTQADSAGLFGTVGTHAPYYRSRYPDLFDRVTSGETFGAVMLYIDGDDCVASMEAVLPASVEDSAGPSVVSGDIYAPTKETVLRRIKDAKTCQACGAPDNLRLCNGCRCTWYCSKECQKTDWPTHTAQCKLFRTLVPRNDI